HLAVRRPVAVRRPAPPPRAAADRRRAAPHSAAARSLPVVSRSLRVALSFRGIRPLALALVLLSARPAAGDEKRVPADLEPPVASAVARAASWLKKQADPAGRFRWSVPDQRDWTLWPATACDQGLTALAVLALARAGTPTSDPAVARALDALRTTLSS